MNIENKKQVAILALALGAGVVATVLVGNYIQDQIKRERKVILERARQEVAPLAQQVDALQGKLAELERRQSTMPTQAAAVKTDTGGVLPKSSLALRTPPGKRAYTVLIDSLAAVGGMVNPGDYVDILSHMNLPDPTTGQTKTVSSMVFQNVQILAVGTNLQAPGAYEAQQQARALNITFALTPQEAELLSFLERNAKMQLILRAPAETEVQKLEAANWNSLADYVKEKQGTELLPNAKMAPEKGGKEEVRPFIQIFQGGREM